ncbi:hypothetical protein [Nocardia blacklockiae]|uniref:hypothetical protein n=1 Tax=Nocardia blacklockiae TaxID=480036 RepID=UPI00189532BD|nr:hypothetical protein [Nocardia blacklockiae]MBF6176026.1 hypothetical protein [Nocardia blacklockiae]
MAATDWPALARILVFVLAAFAAVTVTATMTSSRVALRIDDHGITLGGNPLWRYDATTVTVPWAQITGVVLSTPQLRSGRAPSHIKILHHRPLPSSATVPVGPEAVWEESVSIRPVTGWRLDRAAIATVLAWHAPHIPLAHTT